MPRPGRIDCHGKKYPESTCHHEGEHLWHSAKRYRCIFLTVIPMVASCASSPTGTAASTRSRAMNFLSFPSGPMPRTPARKFFPFAPYFPVTNVIKRYFYPYFPAIIGIKGYSFPYFPYLSGIMKIKTALYSLFSRLDWHKTVVFPCLGEIYEGIRSLSWEIPVT